MLAARGHRGARIRRDRVFSRTGAACARRGVRGVSRRARDVVRRARVVLASRSGDRAGAASARARRCPAGRAATSWCALRDGGRQDLASWTLHRGLRSCALLGGRLLEARRNQPRDRIGLAGASCGRRRRELRCPGLDANRGVPRVLGLIGAVGRARRARRFVRVARVASAGRRRVGVRWGPRRVAQRGRVHPIRNLLLATAMKKS